MLLCGGARCRWACITQINSILVHRLPSHPYVQYTMYCTDCQHMSKGPNIYIQRKWAPGGGKTEFKLLKCIRYIAAISCCDGLEPLHMNWFEPHWSMFITHIHLHTAEDRSTDHVLLHPLRSRCSIIYTPNVIFITLSLHILLVASNSMGKCTHCPFCDTLPCTRPEYRINVTLAKLVLSFIWSGLYSPTDMVVCM